MNTEFSTKMAPPPIENIPGQLAERPQWVCWRLEERDGKSTKVPFVPGTERRASSTDLLTWRTFSEALEAYESGEPPYSGIGFCFCSADPYVGIDLDACRDPQSGVLKPFAQRIVDAFADDAYIEVSPSGSGLHIIVEATLEGCAKTPLVEVYSQKRFFCVTGRTL